MMKTVIALLLLAMSLPALATDYYVKADVPVKNDCLTPETACPFITISQKLTAGDTAYVYEGEYGLDDGVKYTNKLSYFKPVNSGTPDKPITVRGANGLTYVNRSHGWAVLQNVAYINIIDIGCIGGIGACINIKNSHHITIKGLHAKSHWQGIHMDNADDNLVIDSLFEWNKEGIYLVNESDRNTFLSNKFFYNGAGSPKGDRCQMCIGDNPSAGYANAGTGNVIEHNELAYGSGIEGDLSDYAIGIFGAPETAIQYNWVHDNNRGGIMITQISPGSKIIGNLVTNNGKLCDTITNIAAITVRNGSSNTLVDGNIMQGNCIAHMAPYFKNGRRLDSDPRGVLDFRGWNKGDPRVMTGVTVTRNIFKDNYSPDGAVENIMVREGAAIEDMRILQ